MKTCATCGKEKGDKQFRKDGRYKDNLSPLCHHCRGGKQHSDAQALTAILMGADDHDRLALITRVFGALPTVDIPAVPILAAGGPYFGTGSPAEGDFFDKADLELIAEQTNKLANAGELRPPSKLGHSEEQRLLENSGLPVGDELPAAGWLENFRVEKLAGIWKLLADVKQVPAKLGQILASGGYRTRSVELSKVTSQMDGTTYDGVVTGLAWLGAKAPAVRTLDDIWNLYAEAAKGTSFAAGDVVWEEEEGVMDLLSDLTAAINTEIAPNEPSYMWELWVNDVNLALDACTASDWDSDTTWIIPFTIGADNEPQVAARDAWVPSTMKLVEIDPAQADTIGGGSGGMVDDEGEYTARDRYSEMRREARAKFLARADDTKGMKLTDEQVATYAKAFAIEGEGAELRTAVEAHVKDLAGVTDTPEPEAKPEVAPATSLASVESLKTFSTEQKTELESFLKPYIERADRGDRAYATQFARTRDSEIERAMGEGRLNPSDREQWVEFYDANPELALKQLQSLPVNPVLLLTFGVDDDGLTNEETTKLAADTSDAWVLATGAPDPVQPQQAAA